MSARSFARIQGIGASGIPAFSVCRSVLEPIAGLLLTLGLLVTLGTL